MVPEAEFTKLLTTEEEAVRPPPTKRVEEALSGPVTVNGALTVLEALAMKPAVRVARLLTRRVEEALMGPATLNVPTTELEAELIYPVPKVDKPVKVDAPLTRRVLDALSGPATLN